MALTQHRLPVKVTVYNNGSLGCGALEMKGGGFLEFVTDLKIRILPRWRTRPGYMRCARRIRARWPRRSQICRPILARLCSTLSPINRNWRHPRSSLPSRSRASAFGVCAVLNGRGDEIIDLIEGGNVFKSLTR